MKLYFRLLWILLTSPFKKQIKPLDESVTHWQVLPNDLDIYRHMNNGRYPMLMDLARVDFVIRLGMMKKVFKQRWVVPVGNTQIDFKTALEPFAKYRIHTKICYWDDTWFYFKQEFRRDIKPYPIVAEAYVKALFKAPEGLISPAEVIQLLGDDVIRPPLEQDVALKFQLPYLKTQHDTPAKEENASADESLGHTTQEPIAIVGIGCRFPGGVENTDDLWKVLVDGEDCIVDIPSDRWDPKKFHDPSGKAPGRSYVHKGGMLKHNIHEFDPGFFGISPREAEVMDPMQRLLLEVSWEAFEDAGISAKDKAGSKTAVYVGGFITDNLLLQSSAFNRNRLASHSAVASTLTMLSNRLSYFYDFRGPSMSLDTACSSSLVAVHLACQSIWSGDAESALVGGVNMLLVPETQITMSKGKFLSPNGRCNAFGAGADGYVRGEGSAMVVLKPLSEALKGGNQIYSVIRGTAVNQDGKTNGITVPNGEAQMAAMKTSYAMAGIQPSQINYLEAHGTGTPVGDPIEANALGTVLGIGRSHSDPCPIGSLKTNLGHMEAAAGIGGLIKASLVLKHRQLVPHLHLDELNPNIDLQKLNLRIPREVEALPDKGELFAGVNSFGYGGTNAHVTLASAPEATNFSVKQANDDRPLVLPLSATSDESLSLQAKGVLETYHNDQPDLKCLAMAYATQRSHLNHRVWLQANDGETMLSALKTVAEGQRRGSDLLHGTEENPKVMFVYTGMGPQWWAMGRDLYHQEPVYRASLDECDGIFKKLSGWSIIDELCADEEKSRITQTDIAQPANFVLQVGLTKLLASWGVNPDGIMGHSIGEVGAAWASGGLSLEQALTVAYHRSRLQHTTAGKGGMLAVGLTPDDAESLLKSYDNKVSIAAINSPGAVTLAGNQNVLEAISQHLNQKNRFNKFLKVEVPYHSPVMDEIKTPLFEALSNIKTSKTHTPLYSTVSGELMSGTHDKHYWWRNVRQAVCFSKAVSTSLEAGYTLFLEIGPHPVLASSILETAKNTDHTVSSVATLIRKQDDMQSMAQSVGKLYCAGANLNYHRYFGELGHVSLPTYPWNKKVYWAETERSKRYRLPHDGHPMVSRQMSVPTLSWIVDLNASALPYVQDHKVAGSTLFPGSGYVELGLGLAQQLKEKDGLDINSITLEDIEFLAPALATQGEHANLQAKPNTDNQSFKVFYQRGEGAPVVCAQGLYFSGSVQPEPLDIVEMAAKFNLANETVSWTKEQLYQTLAKRGLDYGPSFQGVSDILIKDGEVLATIDLPENISNEGYLLHPILLDCALHSLIASDVNNDSDYDIVPMGIKRFQWFGPIEDNIVAHGQICKRSTTTITGDITLFYENGDIAGQVKGLKCRLIPKLGVEPLERVNQWCIGKSWQAVSSVMAETVPNSNNEDGDWVLIGTSNDRKSLSTEEGISFVPEGADNDEIVQYIRAKSEGVSSLKVLDARFYQQSQVQQPQIQHDGLIENAIEQTDQLLQTLQGLSDLSLDRYVVVSEFGELVESGNEVNLAVAPLIGLAKTAMTERPKLNITLMDLDRKVRSWLDIIKVLSSLEQEQEIALRNDEVFCLRLVPEKMIAPEVSDLSQPSSEVAAYEMRQSETGRIETIEYYEVDRAQLESGEIEIAVDTCSLHFKDLMKTMGILSSEAEADTFFEGITGMEGTGVVSRVGPDVTKFKTGDRVYSLGQFMQSHLVVSQDSAIHIPETLSMTDSANLITYLTVYHSLVNVARLSKGETVLIHSATGGVGLAAIHMARWLGANIITTAGTEEKRAYLKDMGIEHISDSRSLSFVDDVHQWTEGKGVDVVLNFTPGEIMVKSVHCLAPFGRFIELGKISFDKNEALHLRPFNENLSYSSVDFDRIIKTQQTYVNDMVVTLLGLLSRGELTPLPCEVFPASQTVDAFKSMARAKHIGKLAIALKDDRLKVQPKKSPSIFSQDATYIVTGGLGGFGLHVAQWMSVNGAGNLALISRRGASTEEAKAAITSIESNGTTVQAFAADVSDLHLMKNVMQTISDTMPGVKGVMHAAMVLDDKILQEMDRPSLERVINAKAKSAWVLHQLSDGLALDFMIFYSSISSLVGNAGQSNYVAANNFLDQLAHYRQSKGLAGLSINWGVFEETGVVSRNANLAKHLNHIGITPFSSEQATSALGVAITHNQAQIGIMDVDWNRFAEILPEGAGGARFEKLRTLSAEADGQKDNELLVATFGNVGDEARKELILVSLIESVATVMRMDAGDINPSQGLRDLGLDSLMAVEIDLEFSARTGLEIPAMEMSSGPSIEELGRVLSVLLNTKLPLAEHEDAASAA